jgi:hypothetical protein
LPDTDVTIHTTELLKVKEKYPTRFDEKNLPGIAYSPVNEMNMYNCLLMINLTVVKKLQEIS